MSNEDWKLTVYKNPYISEIAEAYVTAVNIVAVEYLVKKQDEEEYHKRCSQIYELDEFDLLRLQTSLSYNKHTSSLGAMIMQGDYNIQRRILIDFLDEVFYQKDAKED